MRAGDTRMYRLHRLAARARGPDAASNCIVGLVSWHRLTCTVRLTTGRTYFPISPD